jgi:hypothetical protein
MRNRDGTPATALSAQPITSECSGEDLGSRPTTVKGDPWIGTESTVIERE